MPEIPNVVVGETILSLWGNQIRDRTVQRYADATERTSLHGAPNIGDLSFLENTGDVDVYYSGAWRHLGVQVGAVQMHGGGVVPPGWLLCNGQAVSRATYSGLFSQIGTTWGTGDGSTTFNVPDMRGRVPRGVAAAAPGNVLGGAVGADTHTHTLDKTSLDHDHEISGITSSEAGHNHTGKTAGARKFSNPGGHTFDGIADISSQAEEHDHLLTAASGHLHDVSANTIGTATWGTPDTASGSTIPAARAINFIIRT